MQDSPDYTPDEQIQRARQAQRLLEDEILAEAFATAEATFVQQWRESEPTDTARREVAYANSQALSEVRRVLHSIISDGEFTVGQIRKRDPETDLADI